MNFINLFTISYWLDTQLFYAPSGQPYLFGFFLLLIALGVLAQRYLTIHKARLFVSAWKKSVSLLYTIGFWGLVLLFFRYENVHYLNMRLWYLVLLGYAVVILFLIFRDYKRKKRDLLKVSKPKIKNKYRSVGRKSKKRKKR